MLKHNEEKYKTKEPVTQCNKKGTDVHSLLKGVENLYSSYTLVVMQGTTHQKAAQL